MNILVDPILVGNLDFGIPWLYDAAKKFLKNIQVSFDKLCYYIFFIFGGNGWIKIVLIICCLIAA